MNHIGEEKSNSLRRLRWGNETLLIACLLPITACSNDHAARRAEHYGNAQSGLMTIERAACRSCHIIPGVPNSDGLVGPPLNKFARRTIVAGLLPNTPDNLIYWLRFSQSVVPGNAMPDTGLSEDEARNVAAYLYTLE